MYSVLRIYVLLSQMLAGVHGKLSKVWFCGEGDDVFTGYDFLKASVLTAVLLLLISIGGAFLK